MSRESSAIETQWFSAEGLHKLRGASLPDGKDLGLGPELEQKYGQRLLNRDGSFNARRIGASLLHSRSLYHYCISISFGKFISLFFVCYVVLNLIFASFYFTLGWDGISGFRTTTALGRFFECFFFSIQTSGTIGYGVYAPQSWAAHVMVSIEAFVSLLSFALATGLLFARFSRPTARLLFTPKALIAPHKNGNSFQFRITNQRTNQLFDLQARLMMSRLELDQGMLKRRFYDMPLERHRIMFFPLQWTVVHCINEDSPMNGMTEKDLFDSDAEFLVMVSGIDDTFSQTVHAWTSYKPHELIWNAKWSNIYETGPNGTVAIKVSRLGEFQEHK